MKRVSFTSKAFEDFSSWAVEDKQIYQKIVSLIKAVLRDPFVGLGKPEPLRQHLQGYWSRRTTQEHRLVYKITDEEVMIVSCKYHYE